MRNYLFFLLWIISLVANGQFRNTPHHSSRHLINEKFYEEAIVILNEKLQYAASQTERDSLNFMLGKTYYIQQRLRNQFNTWISFQKKILCSVMRRDSSLHLMKPT